MAGRPVQGLLTWACRAALGVSLLMLGAHDAPAQDPAAAVRDLEASDDFRVRVSAALLLGRTRAPGALESLERALVDAHPAVRTAAAAGLGALGDKAAIPVLQQRLAAERSAGVRSQMVATIASLQSGGDSAADDGAPTEQRWQRTRYVVAIGEMHNRSEVRTEHASDVLRNATRSRARAIPGALVSDRVDDALFQQAAARHVPVLLLDGALQRLSQGQKNAQLSYSAQVDYSMRRIPQQQLRGMLSGSATSFGSLNALRDPGSVTQLEDQAIEGAVESALRGAAQGFGEAVR